MGKRVLVIGNGFDIEHGYPTKYLDFLYFCSVIIKKKIDYNASDILNNITLSFEIKHKDECLDIKKKIKSNVWIQYFIQRYNKMVEEEIPVDERWIDFENEIKRVCRDYIDYTSGDNSGLTLDDYDMFIISDSMFDYSWKVNEMKSDLNGLIALLDMYLRDVSEYSTKYFSPIIRDFSPNACISFNYTDTVEKVYNVKTIDYIHGKLSNSIPVKKNNKYIYENNNSMVLGFNGFEDAYDIELAEFIKYFQMVKKFVTMDYLNDCAEDSVETMIFGHSMDVTDKDVLTKIISVSKVVYIIYHDDKQHTEMIRNLMKMYYNEEFRNLCMSKNRKIIFIEQPKRQESNSGEQMFCIEDLLATKDDFEGIKDLLSKKNIIFTANNLLDICESISYSLLPAKDRNELYDIIRPKVNELNDSSYKFVIAKSKIIDEIENNYSK